MTDGTSNTFAIGESLYESCQWFSWPNPNGNYAFTSVPVNWKITIFEQTGYGDGTGRLRNSGNWVSGFGFRSKHPGITQFLYGDGRVGRSRTASTATSTAPQHAGHGRGHLVGRVLNRGGPEAIAASGPAAPASLEIPRRPRARTPDRSHPVRHAGRGPIRSTSPPTREPSHASYQKAMSGHRMGLPLVAGPGLGVRRPIDRRPGRLAQALPPLSGEDQAVFRDLESKTNEIINKITLKYTGLRYEYSEGLLKMLDQIESTLSGKAEGDPPRFLSQLDPEEEREHFRETVRRWEEKTGKDLRAEVDALKADVASRPAGKTYYPEFQKKFSQTFDDFIALEVVELRERRNRAIHAEAEASSPPTGKRTPRRCAGSKSS